MKIATIAPIHFLEEILGMGQGQDYHLILASLVIKSETYRRFYRERAWRGDFVILDNDAHELQGDVAPLDQLEQAVDLLPEVTEVILPDRLGASPEETVNLAMHGLERIVHHGHSYMAVPHADNIEDYVTCAEDLVDTGQIACLGIGRHPVKRIGIHREQVVDVLSRAFKHTELHLLGMYGQPRDLTGRVTALVRGTDSCKAVVWGLLGHKLDVERRLPEYPGRPMNYFNIRSLSQRQLDCVRCNIGYWKQLYEGRTEHVRHGTRRR